MAYAPISTKFLTSGTNLSQAVEHNFAKKPARVHTCLSDHII